MSLKTSNMRTIEEVREADIKGLIKSIIDEREKEGEIFFSSKVTDTCYPELVGIKTLFVYEVNIKSINHIRFNKGIKFKVRVMYTPDADVFEFNFSGKNPETNYAARYLMSFLYVKGDKTGARKDINDFFSLIKKTLTTKKANK